MATGKMVNSKRKFVCSKCKAEQMVWEGRCRSCTAIGTLEEVAINARRQPSQSTADQRRLRRRAKDSERGIAKRMVAADGPDPSFSKIASSTGRIGHISGLRIDAVSRTYVTENKNRKMPTWLITAWVLLNQRGEDFQKNILLHVDPPNMPHEYQSQGLKKKLDTMAIIKQSRHEELIKKEKALGELEQILFSGVSNEAKLQQAQNVFTYTELDKLP
jgi:hypothetical protein